MGDRLASDVLLALLDVGPPGIGGVAVQERLASVGRRPGADHLLATLLRLEGTGLVAVDRVGGLRFSLTDSGRERGYEVGGGQPVHLQLLMADLVGFVAFTAQHGDASARAAAGALLRSTSDAVRRAGGEVVKAMGDGVLAWLPPDADPLPVVVALASGCQRPDGQPWSIRAASHVGHPIRHGGDIFGHDVNLVSRLCTAAEPGELVSSSDASRDTEPLTLRGLDHPVSVRRRVIT